MVTVDLCIIALCYFFYKASQEADRDEAREREALLLHRELAFACRSRWPKVDEWKWLEVSWSLRRRRP